MNTYLELKGKHEKQVNSFPMGFAFSDKQFEEAKAKLNVTDNKELLSLGSGGFIRKANWKDYLNLTSTINTENKEAMEDDEYLFQGFLYELGNHEFCITYDPEATLDCFNLTIDQVNDDKRLLDIFKKARIQYLENCFL